MQKYSPGGLSGSLCSIGLFLRTMLWTRIPKEEYWQHNGSKKHLTQVACILSSKNAASSQIKVVAVHVCTVYLFQKARVNNWILFTLSVLPYLLEISWTREKGKACTLNTYIHINIHTPHLLKVITSLVFSSVCYSSLTCCSEFLCSYPERKLKIISKSSLKDEHNVNEMKHPLKILGKFYSDLQQCCCHACNDITLV